MNTRIFTAAALSGLLATSAMAQTAGETSVGIGLSTFGVNLEGAYQIDPQWRARGALMGGFSASYSESDVDGDVDGDFDLGGIALLADYYPMQSGWRVSGGLFFSNTELDASGSIEIDGEPDANGTVKADFENEVAPMITTGYEAPFGDGWSFNSEIGIILAGGIDLRVEADNAARQDDIDNDPDIQEAIDDAGDINVLPYLSFGVSYRF